MSKAGTMYSETEQFAAAKQLDRIGLNPFAFWMMVESYLQIAPLPIKYVWNAAGKDIIMDKAADSKGIVELYIVNTGYIGKKIGDISKLDILATNLFCQSYYANVRPQPISFTVFNNAVEIHLRTPGISDFDKKRKNPFRNIFNPFQEKVAGKKKR